MLVLPHVATGVALGVLIGDPLLVVPAAIASHFLLDSIPHWQETMAPYEPTWKTYMRIPIDMTLALLFVIWAVSVQPAHAIAILLGGAFASIVDLDVLTVKFPKWRRGIVKRFWDWHCRIQRETTSLWGVVTQLGVLCICLVAVYN